MSLDTYSGLKDEIADWLAHSQISSSTPAVDTLIRLCEVKMNRSLRIGLLEKRATYNTTVGDAYVAVPTDFRQVRAFRYQANPEQKLTYASPDILAAEGLIGRQGRPKKFSIIGTEFLFGPAPDAVYTLELIYYAKVPGLSDSQTTNVILDEHPDLYLYGTLLEAAPYLKDDQRIPIWKEKYDYVLGQIAISDRADRWSGTLVQAI